MQPHLNVDKQQLEKRDVSLADGCSLRISVCAEDAAAAPSDGALPTSFRRKRRFRYCYKAEITYDLTIVNSGRTAEEARTAAAEFEVRAQVTAKCAFARACACIAYV